MDCGSTTSWTQWRPGLENGRLTVEKLAAGARQYFRRCGTVRPTTIAKTIDDKNKTRAPLRHVFCDFRVVPGGEREGGGANGGKDPPDRRAACKHAANALALWYSLRKVWMLALRDQPLTCAAQRARRGRVPVKATHLSDDGERPARAGHTAQFCGCGLE
eukprot:3872788-Pleurochrysis_carterae.AAC.1